MTNEEYKSERDKKLDLVAASTADLARDLVSILGLSQKNLVENMLLHTVDYLFDAASIEPQEGMDRKVQLEVEAICQHFNVACSVDGKKLRVDLLFSILLNVLSRVGLKIRFDGREFTVEDERRYLNEVAPMMAELSAKLTGFEAPSFEPKNMRKEG